MIIAVAVDPMAQQPLAYPSRQVLAYNETTFVPYTHEYICRRGQRIVRHTAHSWKLDLSQVEPTLQVAIMGGLTQTSTPLEPDCSSGTRDYPDFVSLGVCSSCEDITEAAAQSCVVDRSADSTGYLVN